MYVCMYLYVKGTKGRRMQYIAVSKQASLKVPETCPIVILACFFIIVQLNPQVALQFGLFCLVHYADVLFSKGASDKNLSIQLIYIYLLKRSLQLIAVSYHTVYVWFCSLI